MKIPAWSGCSPLPIGQSCAVGRMSPELAGNLATMIQALIILFVGAELLIVSAWGLRKRFGFAGPARVQPELKA